MLLRFLRSVVDSEIVLRCFVALMRCSDEPLHGFLHVLRHTATGLVAKAKIALSRGYLLFCGGTIPTHRFFKVLRDDVALLVENAEIELGLRLTAFSGGVIPLHCFGVILRHALTRFVKKTEVEL